MELEKLSRQLNLMTILTQNRTYTIEEICPMVNMSKRTIYRYIDAFRQAGFIVEKEGTRYRLDRHSPFFRKICDQIYFTDDEALTINHLLYSVVDHSPQIRHLREKLSRLYDNHVLASHEVDERVGHNLQHIYRAIREHRVCILRDYNSPSSDRTSDRVVEPFQFLHENTEVRCWELASQTNKTFKISRIGRVDVLDLLWSDTAKHEMIRTDLFHFSGPEQHPVSILLGRLATSLLLEEFPAAQDYITPQDDGRNLLQTDVCSYIGVGRFVLGLYDDIEVVGDEGFKQFLQHRIQQMQV